MGVEGLRTEKPPGPTPKLDAAQREELGAVIDAGPLAAGYQSGGPMIGDLIEQRFGARYHKHNVPRLVHDLGFSIQRPRKRLARADAQDGTVSWYYAIVFLRGDMMVELHRNIVQPYRTGIRIEELWARAQLDPLGSGAQRLDPIDDLLICLVHMARHELAVPAVNYVDVSRMWQRHDAGQRDLLLDRARDYRVERAVNVVLKMTELLAAGSPGKPGEGRLSSIFPTTDDILRGTRPQRLRQIGQKLVLAEGLKERLGLGFTTVAAIVDGWWRSRTEDQR